MASTYTSSLLIEQMATGDQTGTWGATTDTNFTLFEQAIAGYLSVAQGDVANLTLTSTNGTIDQARNAVINFTGALTLPRNVVVPTAEKLYLIRNSTTGGFAITVKTAAGTGVVIPAGYAWWVYCDGTNVVTGLTGPWTYASSALTAEIDTLTITRVSAGASGPDIITIHDTTSPAANDDIGRWVVWGRDSAANIEIYGYLAHVLGDPTSGSEDSRWDFYDTIAGTRALRASIGHGIYMAGAGGDPGAGDIAAITFRGGNGAVSDVTYGYSNNVDTGSYLAAADTIGWATNGTLRSYLSPSGLFVTDDLTPSFGTDSYTQITAGVVQAYIANSTAAYFGRLVSNGDVVIFYKGSTNVGSVSVTASATAYNTSSDGDLKTNFRDFNSSAIIDNLRVGLFDWIEAIGGGTGYGVIAQEAYEVFPDMVTPGDDERPWQADYSKLVPVMLREIQDLRRRLAAAGL